MLKSKFHILSLFLLLASCSISTTKTKTPIFADDNKLELELKSLVNSDNINLDGKEITTNKKTISELEIRVINGQHIPPNEDERKALGKLIALRTKGNLKDPHQFEVYKVVFVTRIQSNGITKENSKVDVFGSAEL